MSYAPSTFKWILQETNYSQVTRTHRERSVAQFWTKTFPRMQALSVWRSGLCHFCFIALLFCKASKLKQQDLISRLLGQLKANAVYGSLFISPPTSPTPHVFLGVPLCHCAVRLIGLKYHCRWFIEPDGYCMANDSWNFIKYQVCACLLSVHTAHENFCTPPLQIAPIKVPDKRSSQ